MNLQQLRQRLDELEAEAGTNKVTVGIVDNGRIMGIERVDHAAYRDSDSESHVFWIIPGRY